MGAPGIDAVCCDQLTPEIAECLAVVDLAVFVDATVGVLPGNVGVVRLGAGTAGQGALVHHVDPAQLLALAGLHQSSPIPSKLAAEPNACTATIRAGVRDLAPISCTTEPATQSGRAPYPAWLRPDPGAERTC